MHNLLITFLVGLSAIFGGQHAPSKTVPQSFGSTYQPARGKTYNLQASIGRTNTSIALSSFTEPISGIPFTMSYLGTSIAYGTLDPQQPTRAELVSFTGITQNANGTALLTGVTRGLTNTYPFTSSTTLAVAHSGQSLFILSDAPQVFAQYPAKVNAESITGVWTFSSTSAPLYDFNPNFNSAASTTFASIGYVASTSYAGTVNASETVKGISELATGPEAALGTSAGGTAARLVLPASLATSTCQVTQNSVIIASTTTGRIDKGCIDQTASYTFSGNNTFSASTTFSATTSIRASSTTTSPFYLNGIPYSFPSTQGASSSVLTNNGFGNLSWVLQGLSYSSVPYSSGNITSGQTISNTYTPGFIPKTITLNYRIGGDSSGTLNYSVGTAVYSATSSSLIVNNQMSQCGGAVSLNNSTGGVINSGAVTCGDPTVSANNAAVTITITNITSTQFSVQAVHTSNNSAPSFANYYVTAQ